MFSLISITVPDKKNKNHYRLKKKPVTSSGMGYWVGRCYGWFNVCKRSVQVYYVTFESNNKS